MAKKVSLVACKNCGAIHRPSKSYCSFCGESLPVENLLVSGTIKKQKEKNGDRKKISLLSVLAIVLGILGIILCGTMFFDRGIISAIAAIVLALIVLNRKQEKILWPAIGLCLGAYVVVVNLFWLLLLIGLFFD